MIPQSINRAWDRWANLHPLLRFLIAGLLLAALGLFGARPAYRAFKAWRLEQNLVKARSAVDEARMSEARDLSLTVLRAGDPRIEAFRILETSTAKLRDPRHGDIARALMFHPESSDDDRFNGFRGFAPGAPLGMLGQAWAALPDDCRRQVRFAEVFADRLLAGRRFNEAASVLLGVPEQARESGTRQRLARVLVGSGTRQGYQEAQRMIASAFSRSDGAPADWLEILEEIPAESLEESLLGPVRAALRKPPVAGGDEARRALMLARMDYAGNYSRRAAVLNAAIERWKDSAPVATAAFLTDLGLNQRLLETFPPSLVDAHPELFPLLLKAMERGGAWDQVSPLLDGHGGQLPKFVELAHRAIAAAYTGDGALRVQSWDAAMNEAKSDPQSTGYLNLHRLADEAGLREEAEQAMIAAIRQGRGPLPLYADLKPLLSSLSKAGREDTLIEICAIYFALEPGNPVLLTQYAYMASLNNLVDPKLILKALEPLAKAFPKELPIQCVLATAYLCDDQPAKAAETLDPLQLEPEKLAPGYRAAYLTTQVLNGRMTPADPAIRDFPWKSLQLSERRKFESLIASVQTEK